jgi:hypothetical protein
MRMTKAAALVATLGCAVLLAGCGSTGIFSRGGPDEFAVQRQTPLVVPPDFALTPPKQGEPRPTTDSLQSQTLDALFGGPSARSDIEKSAIGLAGQSEPGIRSKVGDPNTYTVAKGSVTQQIIAAPEGDGQFAQVSAGG